MLMENSWGLGPSLASPRRSRRELAIFFHSDTPACADGAVSLAAGRLGATPAAARALCSQCGRHVTGGVVVAHCMAWAIAVRHTFDTRSPGTARLSRRRSPRPSHLTPPQCDWPCGEASDGGAGRVHVRGHTRARGDASACGCAGVVFCAGGGRGAARGAWAGPSCGQGVPTGRGRAASWRAHLRRRRRGRRRRPCPRARSSLLPPQERLRGRGRLSAADYSRTLSRHPVSPSHRAPRQRTAGSRHR